MSCCSTLPNWLGVALRIRDRPVLRMDDALPKMRDVPAEMGGSGELMPS